jgi:F0F1-type ATP synthase beta subunit
VALLLLTVCQTPCAFEEVCALLGHMPSAVGYQPTLATDSEAGKPA